MTNGAAYSRRAVCCIQTRCAPSGDSGFFYWLELRHEVTRTRRRTKTTARRPRGPADHADHTDSAWGDNVTTARRIDSPPRHRGTEDNGTTDLFHHRRRRRHRAGGKRQDAKVAKTRQGRMRGTALRSGASLFPGEVVTRTESPPLTQISRIRVFTALVGLHGLFWKGLLLRQPVFTTKAQRHQESRSSSWCVFVPLCLCGKNRAVICEICGLRR